MKTFKEYLPERFEIIWFQYPEKKGKHEAWIKFKNQVKTVQDWLDIQKALQNYIKDMERIRKAGHPDRRWQYGSTWFNHYWRDYVDYKPPESTDPWDDVVPGDE